MSSLICFDIHVARINATTTMEEFIRDDMALVYDDRYVKFFTFAPCCIHRLICMRSYAEPVKMVTTEAASEVIDTEDDQPVSNYTTDPSAGPSAFSIVALYTINTPTAVFAVTPTTTAAPSPAATTAGTPTSAACTACSECRRKKRKCVRPSGQGSCDRCLRAKAASLSTTLPPLPPTPLHDDEPDDAIHYWQTHSSGSSPPTGPRTWLGDSDDLRMSEISGLFVKEERCKGSLPLNFAS